MFYVTGYDLIQIVMLVGACWGCYLRGRQSMANDIKEALEEQGVMFEDEE